MHINLDGMCLKCGEKERGEVGHDAVHQQDSQFCANTWFWATKARAYLRISSLSHGYDYFIVNMPIMTTSSFFHWFHPRDQ